MKTKNEQQTIPASPRINNYFAQLQKRTQAAFALAEKARKKHYDPVDHVEIVLAKNLAERVVGIISAVAPQIKNSGVVQRILELEKHYGALDWRVALIIAHEVAQEKFCTFKDKREAMEVGIRVGFAYVTVGVVSAPIEGFVTLELKDRRDKQGKYFCLVFAGPVRGAGGTAASVAVLIADYVRKKMGYATYDPDEKEVARTYAELEDYHEWVTNLQYFPSKEEADFMTKHLPLEISGDPSEKYEISNVNLKDLPRVPTNNLRSGFCLIHSSCLELKAPKLWGKIRKWAKEMDLEHWSFLEEFIAIQKKAKAKNTQATTQETSRITPDYTYIKDVVAGRPVFSHPLRPGGFRLRYGRGRASGFSAQSIHPATMIVTNNFIATGTQLKVERPGKAAAITPCDTIEGPIVLLRNGSVKKITTEDQARKLQPHIKNILFLGDILINYGDFFDRAHTLAPAGYTPEEWILELQNYLTTHHETTASLAEKTNINNDKLHSLFESPLTTTITSHEAWTLATTTNTPLHPDHLYYWSLLT
ncbi:DNA polymerase II large subunit, partial [Candidatus Woesearchaeota archaeon]